MVAVIAVAAAWLAFGAVAAVLMHRRGHETFSWAVLFLFLGPIAVPLAISADRHPPAEPPRPLPMGGLDVLVAHDGSTDADAALDTALGLLGDRMTSLTLAAVLDLEAASTVRGREAQHEAEARLAAVIDALADRTTVPLASVVLFGEPAAALQHFAGENGYEVVVAGNGTAHRISRHQHQHRTVPMLIGPAS